MTPVSKSPLRGACLIIVMVALAPRLGAQEAAASAASGAPDPCALISESDASAIAGTPMHRQPPDAPSTLVRGCTYSGAAAGGRARTSLHIGTYRMLTDPAATVHMLERNPWGKSRFQHEPEFGPLATSLTTQKSVWFTGYKGRTGLTIRLDPLSPASYALLRRGFASAMRRMP